MNRTKMLAGLGLGLGLSSLACGTGGADPNADTDGLPPLTAEQRAVVAKMDRGTLAEITLPEGTMRFVEIAPGEVMILRQINMGAQVTRVQGESAMTLPELFHAYAPAREVPRTLYDAMDRVTQASLSARARTAAITAPGASGSFAGPPVEAAAPVAAPDGIEGVASAVTSTIDATWFVNNFCNLSGINASWCFPTAWVNAWGARHSHRTNSVTCGDTGAARTLFTIDGNTQTLINVGFRQCRTMGYYHGPHGWFGVNLERDLKHTVIDAEATVRFAGWFADEDQFISAF
jgi:hypothetical protein